MYIYIPFLQSVQILPSIVPVFLPFSGCPTRCIFCAQHVQTGMGHSTSVDTLNKLTVLLDSRQKNNEPPVELGFFGGTFTAMPAPILQACMEVLREYRQRGVVTGARCSTRPDAVNAPVLDMLREAGVGTVELGVQSFADQALLASRRAYDGDCARAACEQVRAAGLRLGVQLLPGMPGVTPNIFLADVDAALHEGAQMLRYYPCLVIEGTDLARLWREGSYVPWALAETVDALSTGYQKAQNAQVPVIRMGLAPEKMLESSVLAGPQHPALGSMVQGLALLRLVVHALAGRRAVAATFPRWCQGFFWGHGQSLRSQWSALGLESRTVHWNTENAVQHCVVEVAD